MAAGKRGYSRIQTKANSIFIVCDSELDLSGFRYTKTPAISLSGPSRSLVVVSSNLRGSAAILDLPAIACGTDTSHREPAIFAARARALLSEFRNSALLTRASLGPPAEIVNDCLKAVSQATASS